MKYVLLSINCDILDRWSIDLDKLDRRIIDCDLSDRQYTCNIEKEIATRCKKSLYYVCFAIVLKIYHLGPLVFITITMTWKHNGMKTYCKIESWSSNTENEIRQ